MCKTLAIRVRGGVYMIPLEEIVYLENRLRKIRVCMPGKEIEFYGTFDGVLQTLTEQRSYTGNAAVRPV